MKLLELTLQPPTENLAVDEALLEFAESHDQPVEVLRLWEFREPVVIVGRGSRVATEVDVDQCRRRQIPILRRCSGGAAVVGGPGCLMYSVLLSYQRRPDLRMIERAHRFVLQTTVEAVKRVRPEAGQQGTSDLTLDGRKFSGNSLRCRRSHLLYHGTLLYDFPLPLIGDLLKTPPREPDYRQGRPHGQFICNLTTTGDRLRELLASAWPIEGNMELWPRELSSLLAADKYSKDSWNLRL